MTPAEMTTLILNFIPRQEKRAAGKLNQATETRIAVDPERNARIIDNEIPATLHDHATSIPGNSPATESIHATKISATKKLLKAPNPARPLFASLR
jgi:hypothetical protein